MENAQANSLSQLATSTVDSFMRAYVKHLEGPSIDENIEVCQVKYELRWMDPIIKYLTSKVLPNDSKEARQIKWLGS